MATVTEKGCFSSTTLDAMRTINAAGYQCHSSTHPVFQDNGLIGGGTAASAHQLKCLFVDQHLQSCSVKDKTIRGHTAAHRQFPLSVDGEYNYSSIHCHHHVF